MRNFSVSDFNEAIVESRLAERFWFLGNKSFLFRLGSLTLCETVRVRVFAFGRRPLGDGQRANTIDERVERRFFFGDCPNFCLGKNGTVPFAAGIRTSFSESQNEVRFRFVGVIRQIAAPLLRFRNPAKGLARRLRPVTPSVAIAASISSVPPSSVKDDSEGVSVVGIVVAS